MLRTRLVSTIALLASSLRADGKGYDQILKNLDERRTRLEQTCGEDVFATACTDALKTLMAAAEQENNAFQGLDENARQKVMERRQTIRAQVAGAVQSFAALTKSPRKREERVVSLVEARLGADAAQTVRRVLSAVNGLAAKNGGPIDVIFHPESGRFTFDGLRNLPPRDLDAAIARASAGGWTLRLEDSATPSPPVMRLVPPSR